MDRRGFLTSLAIAPFILNNFTTQQATANHLGLYPEKLRECLEKEVEQDYKRYSLRREDIQRNNLKTAFSIVNPETNTDLAFVVWCGDRYVPVADLAFRYRDSKQTGKSWCDHYPYISFDVDTKDVRAPNTAGIFAFKEELAYLLGELADLNIRDAMQALWSIYRGSSGLFFKRNTINVFKFHVPPPVPWTQDKNQAAILN